MEENAPVDNAFKAGRGVMMTEARIKLLKACLNPALTWEGILPYIISSQEPSKEQVKSMRKETRKKYRLNDDGELERHVSVTVDSLILLNQRTQQELELLGADAKQGMCLQFRIFFGVVFLLFFFLFPRRCTGTLAI
jgi:hypothetical protein